MKNVERRKNIDNVEKTLKLELIPFIKNTIALAKRVLGKLC